MNDPAISEFHAYVTFRNGALALLPLRGTLRLFDTVVRDLVLEVGQRIELRPGLDLVVEEISLPQEVVEVRAGTGWVPLTSTSVGMTMDGRLVQPTDADACVRLWTNGDGWFGSAEDETVVRLDHGTATVGGIVIELRHTNLRAASTAATVGAGTLPLTIQARFDSVLIHRIGLPIARLSGVPARILTTLAELAGPTHWSVAAAEVWPSIKRPEALRRRWDRGLHSLRSKLGDLGIRQDLFRTQGGLAEVCLTPDDSMEVMG